MKAMFLFFKIIFLLDIKNIKISFKNYTMFKYNTESVLSYGYMRDTLKTDINNRSNFFFKTEDESELFFYQVSSHQNNIEENRIYIIENKKTNTMKNFKLKINNNCVIYDKNPKFEIFRSNDNYQEIKVENFKNYSKFVWENSLKKSLSINKQNLVANVQRILKLDLSNLNFLFDKYPFLYFNESLESLFEIFSILLDKIILTNNIDYDEIKEIYNVAIENYNQNLYMQRYHMIYGQDITNESKDFFLSCIFTDIANILNFFDYTYQYNFVLYNFINCENLLYGDFFVGFIVPINIYTVKLDVDGNFFIKIFYNENKVIERFLTIRLNEKILILILKNFCLNNSITELKIIIHTKNKIFESNIIDIKKYVYD